MGLDRIGYLGGYRYYRGSGLIHLSSCEMAG
jgi:hypothetical protein